MSLSGPARSHGIYDMKAFGSMLRIRAAGGWSDETTRRFNEDYRRHISSLGSPWGVYLDLRHWDLVRPDTVPALKELGSWDAPQGKGAHMFLFNGATIRESLFAGFMNVTRQDTYFFTTSLEAGDWLRQRDYCIGDIDIILEPIVRD